MNSSGSSNDTSEEYSWYKTLAGLSSGFSGKSVEEAIAYFCLNLESLNNVTRCFAVDHQSEKLLEPAKLFPVTAHALPTPLNICVEFSRENATHIEHVKSACASLSQYIDALEYRNLYQTQQPHELFVHRPEFASHLLKTLPNALVIMDERGGLLHVNQLACQVFGAVSEGDIYPVWPEIRGKVFRFYSKENDQEFGSLDAEDPRPSASESKENSAMLWKTEQCFDATGKLIAYIAYGRDVTAERMRENELAKKNVDLARTFDFLEKSSRAAQIGYWEFDLDTQELNWSPVTREIHGVPEGFVPDVSTAIEFYQEGESRQLIQQALVRCVEHGEAYDLKLEILTYSKERKWVRAVGLLDTSISGVRRVYGLFQDIQQRMLGELKLSAALREQARVAQRLELANRSASFGVWDWDLVNDELVWDPLMYQIYGVEKNEVSDASSFWKGQVVEEDLPFVIDCLHQGIKHHVSPVDCFFRIRHFKTGDIRYIRGCAAIELDASKKLVRMSGVNVDVTQEHLAAETLKKAQKEAEAASQLKSEFLATMSHEIRTPINGVLGMLGLLQKSALDEKAMKKVNIAKDSADSLLLIINDILQLSKIEAGRLVLEELNFNLVETIERSARNITAQAEKKNIEVLLDVSGIDTSIVVGDSSHFIRILNNLLSNAVKFTEKGSVVVKANLQEGEGDKLLFSCSVKDSGIGIAEDKLSLLFESFSQVDASITRKYGGTGLGLAISKRLCNLMDGDISVSSCLGQGTEFVFALPLKKSARARKNVDSLLPLGRNKLFIVDHQASRLELYELTFAKRGIATACAFDLSTAIEEISAMDSKGCTVLIDAEVLPDPGNSQLDELRRLRDNKQLRLLLLSRASDVLPEERGGGLFHHVLLKPLSLTELAEALQSNSSSQNNGSASQQGEGPSAWPESTRILLAEDNPVNRLVTSEMLARYSLKCDFAEDGEKAITQLKSSPLSEPYSLVLMDCNMPLCSGYETTQRIRRGEAGDRYTEIPIIAYTANALSTDREKCLRYGMNDYICKPVSTGSLESALQRWIK